jgi:hypothetical protein
MAAVMLAALEGDDAGMDLLLDDLSEAEIRMMTRALVWTQAAQLVWTKDGQATAEQFAQVYSTLVGTVRGIILDLRMGVDRSG